MNLKLLLVSFVFSIFFFPTNTLAHDSFITLVNPVRISSYTKDSSESIHAQLEIVKKYSLPATWLITYDVLLNENDIHELSRLPTNHEIGLFLEVDEPLANDAKVSYKKPDYWYHPNSLFLSGYTQKERIKLIDTLFGRFKRTFGYYPTSVGSWWTDSFSLSYMRAKYGITANLMCSDQFDRDNYQLWGQPWGTPYLPSTLHAAEPGQQGSQIPVVMMQWALRDPLHGYSSSLYSTQDYFTTEEKLDESYFEKLLSTYLFDEHNKFGQVVVGLEADFNPKTYSEHFEKQLQIVQKYEEQKEVKVTTMKEFSNWYLKTFEETPVMHFVTEDLQGTNVITEWYTSPSYRIALKYQKNSQETTVFDWRIYNTRFQEPYFISPNRNTTLQIVVPSVIDGMMDERRVWTIPLSSQEIDLNPDHIVLKKIINIPVSISQSELVTIQNSQGRLQLVPTPWKYDTAGTTYRTFTPETRSLLFSTKIQIVLSVAVIILLILIYRRHIFLVISIIILCGVLLFTQGTSLYLVPAGELQALLYLKSLPDGAVLVQDTECLQCVYSTSLKPAAFVNGRRYIKVISGKPVLKSESVFIAPREKIKAEFQKTRSTYIYLVKFEGYEEKLPYSPGDTGVKKVFENANAVIWEKE